MHISISRLLLDLQAAFLRGKSSLRAVVDLLLPIAILIAADFAIQKVPPPLFAENGPKQLLRSAMDDLAASGIIVGTLVVTKMVFAFYSNLRLNVHFENSSGMLPYGFRLTSFAKFVWFYLLWHLAFSCLALSIIFVGDYALEAKAQWAFVMLGFAIAFPIYYAGISLAAFFYSSTVCLLGYRRALERLRLCRDRILIFYVARCIAELSVFVALPVLILRHSTASLTLIGGYIVVAATFGLLVRCMSVAFKRDIFLTITLEQTSV